MKILFVGDIVGGSGRRALRELAPRIVNRYDIDCVIANAENAAGGFGITPKIVDELLENGVDLITTGNHIWDKKEIMPYLDSGAPIIRPGNYPPGAPGKGVFLVESPAGEKLSIINASGRVFMGHIDCPFRYLDEEVDAAHEVSAAVLVDFHAEATSEKNAMGKYLDGRASCVLGTHTHVQTADERVSSSGTGYITDVGMTGAMDSIIGMKSEDPIYRFLTGLPKKFEPAKGDIWLHGVVVEVNCNDGRCTSIERIKEQL